MGIHARMGKAGANRGKAGAWAGLTADVRYGQEPQGGRVWCE